MNKCLNVIGILLALLLFPYCGKKEAQQIKWQDSRTHAALAEIDSLMWHRADSAFVLLQEFVVSPEVKELDTFDGHYCQLLISELLYKNDYKQTNRPDLLQAVAYFDSLVRQAGGARRAGGSKTTSRRNNNLAFLDARAHYINGVGYYENDSVVEACKEYMKALEIMEDHFEEKELKGQMVKFMALAYTRLTDLYSDMYLHEQAIYFAQLSLASNKKIEVPRWHIARMLCEIGVQYHLLEQLDSAEYYYYNVPQK